MSNVIAFPSASASATVVADDTRVLNWGDITRLGKSTVCRMLAEYGVVYSSRTNYFRLCSLLKSAIDAYVAEQASIAYFSSDEIRPIDALRIRKAESRLAQARTPEQELTAISDVAMAKLDALMV